ncbi:hypothetical protein MKZ38_004276 [Zalerion maritima]|uniref:Uncharacterized protein n=1 Tax=Zalerion maritima TaxID=339359 RepID=A0AAD5WR62_9PEZI|nr:hypothetical protein MKZ38_004276 [Zalerion maritima]
MRAAAVLPFLGLARAAMRRSPDAALMPRETNLLSDDEMPLAEMMDKGISPVPTQAPKPRYAEADLFAREVESNTCGYVHYNDDPDDDVYAISCDTAYTCTNAGTIRDCCASSSCSAGAFSTVCLDAVDCPSDGPSAGTFCCTYSTRYPYCASYLWSTSTDPTDIYTLLNCRVDTTKRIGVIEADSTTSGESSEPTPETTASTDEESGSGGTVTATPTGSTETPITDTNQDEDTSDGGGGGSNTGAIVGGVVGGVAGIGLIVLAGVLLYKHRSRKSAGGKDGGANAPATQFSNQPQPQSMQQTYGPGAGAAAGGMAAGYAAGSNANTPGNTQSMYSHPPPHSPDPSAGYPSPTASPAPKYGHMSQYSNMDASMNNNNNSNAISPSGYSNPAGTPGTMYATPSPGNDGGGQGYPIPPAGSYPVQNQSPGPGGYNNPQAPGQVAEAPTDNVVGSHGNRAELG